MSSKQQIRSDLGKARGLGSAHHGSGHWMHQKMTALANIPLVIWFVYSMVALIGSTYTEYTAWLAQPVNAILMILLVISAFYHAVLGSQVVVEDYISNKGFRMMKIIGNKLFFFAFAVACIFSILKVAFTA